MAEDPQVAPAPAEQAPTEQPQTVELPLAAFGDVAVGDSISLKVVSVDEQAGVINAAPAQAEDQSGGSDALAAQLDKAPQ